MLNAVVDNLINCRQKLSCAFAKCDLRKPIKIIMAISVRSSFSDSDTLTAVVTLEERFGEILQVLTQVRCTASSAVRET